MSRLESFIRRMQAQRDCINLAAELVEGVPGVVWEFGLGNGRSFDHLRETLPGREIYVFDLEPYAPAEFRPPQDRLIVGDVRETLPAAVDRMRGTLALLHCDVGTGHREDDLELVKGLSEMLPAAFTEGAIALSVYELNLPNAEPVPLPDGITIGKYFIYRCHAV
ncbi:MAG: class I SAM-dependent methyltransferase [Hyphomicrobiales bacterium]